MKLLIWHVSDVCKGVDEFFFKWIKRLKGEEGGYTVVQGNDFYTQYFVPVFSSFHLPS